MTPAQGSKTTVGASAEGPGGSIVCSREPSRVRTPPGSSWGHRRVTVEALFG
ncbi:hypothetical protein AB0F91_16295 [Amycolatopsis sp. NPDC023774]|uniref:hypothetical protein n=1 Tax=Amycolatopsis sp. NPDC023774 TaxID=3155015 RepID=UPI0033E0D38C